MSWESNIIVMDLETGGLITKTTGIPPITEIAMISLNYADLSDGIEYSSLVKPYVSLDRYTQIALDTSHITIDMLEKGGKSPEVVLKECVSYLKKVGERKKPILCGHNLDAFDLPIIQKFFEDFGEDITKYVETKFSIDTMWWSRFGMPSSPNYTLGTCLQEKNIDILQAHRALSDTRATKELVRVFLQNLRGSGPLTTSTESVQSRPVVEKQSSFRNTFKFQM